MSNNNNSNVTTMEPQPYRLMGGGKDKTKQTIIFQTVKGFLAHWDEFQWYWKNVVGKKYYILSSFKDPTIRYVKINVVEPKLILDSDILYMSADTFDRDAAELELLHDWDELVNKLNNELLKRALADGQGVLPTSFVHAWKYPLIAPTQSYGTGKSGNTDKRSFPVGNITEQSIEEFNNKEGMMTLEISYGGTQRDENNHDEVFTFLTIAPWRDAFQTIASIARHGKKFSFGTQQVSGNKRVRREGSETTNAIKTAFTANLETLVSHLPDI